MKQDSLAEGFEQHRQHLVMVAYRMLGSLSDAEDSVQEAWLRLSRTDADEVHNLGGWLTTVVSRICLDALRWRKSRREESLEEMEADGGSPLPQDRHWVNAAYEAEMADSVGLALLVVLDRLSPAERVAFVLHDTFDVPYEDIAPVVGRTPEATRQLASRARRRVMIDKELPDVGRDRKRELIEAYLAAARRGDFEALMTVLDPNIRLETDAAAKLAGVVPASGAEALASAAVRFRAFSARPIYVNGQLAIVVAPRGHFKLLFLVDVEGDRIARVTAVADPQTIASYELAVDTLPAA